MVSAVSRFCLFALVRRSDGGVRFILEFSTTAEPFEEVV
jgi:hypothetical protein